MRNPLTPTAPGIELPPDGRLVYVRTGEFAVGSHPQVLVTLALGSCVGVALWDARHRNGALAHVMLPAPGTQDPVGDLNRFASHAVPAMAASLAGTHGIAGLVAKVVGGAAMFSGDTLHASIGERNIAEVHRQLGLLSIPIVAEDTGGSCARTAALRLDSGVVTVRGYACGTREL
ncbi:MAG TPA: chemotaxis protein CheD [Coriobacteriia bacterium]|nr:chemotaxis protein CheD [Coriobacteriia bacterium]